jgi:hypothetical protein
MEAFLGFFSHQEEDLSDARPQQFGGRVIFRKAPPMYSTGRFMPGDCRLRWDSVVRTHIFYLTVWFQKKRYETLLVVTNMWHDFLVHGEVN